MDKHLHLYYVAQPFEAFWVYQVFLAAIKSKCTPITVQKQCNSKGYNFEKDKGRYVSLALLSDLVAWEAAQWVPGLFAQ